MSKTALVTGATSGIGRALVERLVAREVRVFATGRNQTALAELAKMGVTTACYDLSEASAAGALYREVSSQFGPPDFLINNAGYNSRKAAWVEVSDEEMDKQWMVNFRAPAILCREALKEMSVRRSGHIVNVLSSVALHSNPTMGLYTAMKEGLYGLTKVLIKEARESSVKVTAVHPGGTDTGFREKPRPDYIKAESAAHMLCDVLFAPEDVVVHELTFRPLVETNF